MDKFSIPAVTSATRTYYLLTKPGIVMGNAITMAGGFALASRGHLHLILFLTTLLGLSLVMASACVFNNYIDRKADEKMVRTKNRALVKKLISGQNALFFATILGLIGTLCLALFVNWLSMAIALFGFFMYVVVYSFSKYRTSHGTLIGSVAGAVPPVVGYCAVSNQLDAGAMLFFAMIVAWQMPHFFAIAIYRIEDYRAAAIPVLPLHRGIQETKAQMLIYIAAFSTISSLLTLLKYTSTDYLIVSIIVGLAWLILCLQGFTCNDDRAWARKMFIFSLAAIMILCAIIPWSCNKIH